MKFAYIADFSWWCLHRDGMGLVKYGSTEESSWDLLHFYEHECEPSRLESYDLVRLGSLPLYYEFERRGLIDSCRGAIVVTLASFRDAVLRVLDEGIEKECYPKSADAIVYNDNRMAPGLMALGLPMLYAPDKADAGVFRPDPSRRPHDGPLRVGWCGSEASWQGQKNVGMLVEAAESVSGIELVMQRREVEGIKGEAEMVEWYNGLDAYITVNIPETCTPVPVLESALCGVPSISTLCGEAWHMAAVQIPTLSEDSIVKALTQIKRLGRQRLRIFGSDLAKWSARVWSWRCGEAARVTHAMEALCRT